MYPNLETKKIKYENTKTNDRNKIIKKIILIPDVKIKIDQLRKTKRVWPISGCTANNKATANVVMKENKYFILILLYFLLLKIKLIKTIKKGFTNSIG